MQGAVDVMRISQVNLRGINPGFEISNPRKTGSHRQILNWPNDIAQVVELKQLFFA